MQTYIKASPILATIFLALAIFAKENFNDIWSFVLWVGFSTSFITGVVDFLFFLFYKDEYISKLIAQRMPKIYGHIKFKSKKEIDQLVDRFIHDVQSDTQPIKLKKYTSFGEKS